MARTNPPPPPNIGLVTSSPFGHMDGSFRYADGAVWNASGSGCSDERSVGYAGGSIWFVRNTGGLLMNAGGLLRNAGRSVGTVSGFAEIAGGFTGYGNKSFGSTPGSVDGWVQWREENSASASPTPCG